MPQLVNKPQNLKNQTFFTIKNNFLGKSIMRHIVVTL